MALQLLYLVVASSGLYDCYTRWVVAAFPTLEDALAHRDLATQASREAIDAYKRSAEGRNLGCIYFDAPTKYDLAHSVRDTEVSYRVEPVPFVTDALGSSGLMAIAHAVGCAEAVTRELNFPGFAQKTGRPQPQLAVEVKSDFADKLKAVLAQ